MPSRSNWEAYGQAGPPPIDLKKVRNTKVPVALFPGAYDALSALEDTRWLRDELLDGDKLEESKTVVHYDEYLAGHYTFIIGKNMSYFDEVLSLIDTYKTNTTLQDEITVPVDTLSYTA
jgi:hypothetical protein